jgi:hypothetical protein
MSQLLATVGVIGTVSAVAALGGLLSFMPDNFESGFVPFPLAVTNLQETLTGRHWERLDGDTFRLLFRTFLFAAWLSYAVALAVGLGRGAVLSVKVLVPVATALALALAIFSPSVLSCDPYHYAGEGRLIVLHGRNPYSDPLTKLGELGDPTGPFMGRAITSVYGPVWLVVDAIVVAVLSPLPLWYQVVGFKLIAAAALLGMAFAARGIAEHFQAGSGPLTFLAVAFNPLFLMEGPATGHNDLLMMGLFLWGAWCFLKDRWVLGSLLLGLAAGIKYLPAATVPLLLLEHRRTGFQPVRTSDRLEAHPTSPKVIALLTVLLVAAPSIVCYLPFAHDSKLVEGLQAHFTREPAAEVKARIAWLEEHGVPKSLAAVAPSLSRQLPPVILYLGLLAWLWWRPTPGNWLLAWPFLSLGLFVFTLGIWYPWYLVWPWSVAATRWGRASLYPSFACFALAVPSMLRYTYDW